MKVFVQQIQKKANFSFLSGVRIREFKKNLKVALDQGSAGSWCSRAKFKVSKIIAGSSFSFSDI